MILFINSLLSPFISFLYSCRGTQSAGQSCLMSDLWPKLDYSQKVGQQPNTDMVYIMSHIEAF